ncbi:MAG: hypothetical protein LCH46_09410 [Proteobacteria bacterium]|nr:hypothetical protein [Pseudomonadota bacterium]
MALVVEFQLRERQPRKKSEAEGVAEIIIFPGVRFERLDSVPEVPEPNTPDKRVRAGKH